MARPITDIVAEGEALGVVGGVAASIPVGAADDQTAAEVPFTPAGDLSATNVQAALVELDTEKSGTGHTHTPAASSVTIADAGGYYTGTDVEAALQEIGAGGGGGGSTAFVGARVYRSAAYNLPNNAITPFPFDAEAFDTDGFHDNATNNSRLTVPVGADGYYLVGATVGLNSITAAAGRFLVYITKNTAVVQGGRQEQAAASGASPAAACSVIVYLAAGDYVEVNAFQQSGAVQSAITDACGLWISRIGG